MTALRPIEPIDTRGLTPRAPTSGAPIFEHVDPRTLVVDPTYQRSLSERSHRMIRRIIEGYEWTKFRPPVCAFADDGDGNTVLKVIDGQHTAIAAASNPHVTTIPVQIVEAPDTQSQAQAFIGQNTDRLGITAPQMHVAAVAAGDPEAVEVERACQAASVTILRHPPSGGAYKAGQTVAVAAIKALLKKDGGFDHAAHVLAILSAAGLAPIKADHIKAVDRLLTEAEFGAVDPDALASSIVAYPAAMKDAAAFGATHSLPLWKALASVWFQKAKKRRTSSAGSEKVSGEAQKVQVEAGSPPVRGQSLPDDVAAMDPRPPMSAWQPGNHIRRCVKCDKRFRGGRLATDCAPCAYGGADG